MDHEDSSYRSLEILILCVAATFVVWGTYARPVGEPALSRLATVYSLTEYGSFCLDPPPGAPSNPFGATIDKVMVRGRAAGNGVVEGVMISSKPPLMPLVMTAEYVVLNKLFGWDLDDEADCEPIVRLMTLSLVGAAYLTALWLFSKTLGVLGCRGPSRAVLVASLAFGTQLWGFSTLLNNHVPAACMVVASVYLALGLGGGALAPKPWRFLLFGLCAGLVPTVDMPAGVFPFLAAVYLVARFPKQMLSWGVLGAAVPLGLHAGVMIAVTGSPLPVQVRHETYLYETAYWRHPMGIDGLSEPKSTYLFHMTFGRCGLFSLYPVLLAGVAGAVRAAFRRSSPWRGAILAGALGFAVLTFYYATSTNNYGGECYGFRWYIATMPVLLLMGAPLVDSLRMRWQWVFLGFMIGISCYSAW
ncbi:MAG: hypothetical protein JXR94_08205, partial [Candidatus Hydrogenedentes bacterium]|nr:hypothetical protein [Candidatus Hydrogenedentota bacterium]